jgi:tRNA pseudouridine65 synthase
LLEIIYEDDFLVAINKPHGLMVHRSKIANDVSEFALQLLRDQLGMKVYPCHRIDRKTSGVLLFTKDEKSNRTIQMMFQERQINKKYLAIVRGFTKDSETIDYPLKREDGTIQEAVTSYKTLDKTEIDLPYSGQPTSRYSLLELSPETGRTHQIRRHLAHIRHPIIGDRPHGCNKQNKLFKEKWDMINMMLHAYSLEFEHPTTGINLVIKANPSTEFIRTFEFLNFQRDILVGL